MQNVVITALRPDICILDKKRRKIVLIEMGFTSQDKLHTVETEKMIYWPTKSDPNTTAKQK